MHRSKETKKLKFKRQKMKRRKRKLKKPHFQRKKESKLMQKKMLRLSNFKVMIFIRQKISQMLSVITNKLLTSSLRRSLTTQIKLQSTLR